MKITNLFLISQEQFDCSKSRDFIPLRCSFCYNSYYRMKKHILDAYVKNGTYSLYCSPKCFTTYIKSIRIDLTCANCNKHFKKQKSKVKDNNFVVNLVQLPITTKTKLLVLVDQS